MGTLTSTLIMRLIDGVSGPAAGAKRSLRSLDATAVAAARRNEARERRVAAFSRAGSALAIAGTAAAAYAAVQGTRRYAELERRMTRVAITADATAQEQKAAFRDVQNIAQATAQPVEDVMSGVEALVQQGKSLSAAMAFMPSVAATAQASGSAVNDIATSAGAVADQLEITAERMQVAFDIMAAGGKAGKFELKDMAQYLPSLAAQSAAVGLKGEDGLRKLVAMLQVVRNQTGDSSEAATSLQNIFAKMESEQTAKAFKDMGVNLRKEMAAARKDGKPLLDTFIELSDRALKGDLSKLPQLFRDMEFARGMRALLSQKGAVDALVKSLNAVDGTSMRDLSRVLDDAQASLDRMSNSWDRLMSSTGRAADKIGVDDAFAALSNWLDGNLDKLDRGASAIDQIGAAIEAAKKQSPTARAGIEGIEKGWEDTKSLMYYASGAWLWNKAMGPDLTTDPSRGEANKARSRAEEQATRAAEAEAAAAVETDKAKKAELQASAAAARRAEANERRAQGVHAARDISDYEAGQALADASNFGKRIAGTTPREQARALFLDDVAAGKKMLTRRQGFSAPMQADRFEKSPSAIGDTPSVRVSPDLQLPNLTGEDLTEAGRQMGETFLAGMRPAMEQAVVLARQTGSQIEQALSVTANVKVNMPNVNRAMGAAAQNRMDASFSDGAAR